MKNKKLILIPIIFVASILFILSIIFPSGYLVGGDFSYLISIFILSLLFIWGSYMVYRIQYTFQRKIVIIIVLLLITWFILRFIKWLPNIHYLSLYIDYFYYILIMSLPVLFLILIGETFYAKYKSKNVFYFVVSSISLIFILFSLTNNFHFLIYKNIQTIYHPDSNIESIIYEYGIVHYIAMGYIGLLSLFDLIIFYIGTKKQSNFKQFIIPILLVIVFVTYSFLYTFNIPFIKDTIILKDFVFILSIFIMSILESMLFAGLIQNNGKYIYNFKKSIIPMRIYNHKEKVIYSTSNFDSNAYRNFDNKFRYVNIPLGTKHLIVEENIEEINNIKKSIEEENNKLKDLNLLLEKTINVIKDKPSLTYRLDLTNELEKSIEEEKNEVKILINSLPEKINDDNKEDVNKSLGKIALLLGYMKQKCMLLIELKKNNYMDFDAYNMLINVITKDILSVGFLDVAYSFSSKDQINISFLVSINDLINKLALSYCYSNSSILIIVDPTNEKVVVEFDNNKLDKLNIFIPNTIIKCVGGDSLRYTMTKSTKEHV